MNPVDPFDLPEWLATEEVTWHAVRADRAGHLLHGLFISASGNECACNLLAVDQAWPRTVASAQVREKVHLTWRNGEVELAEIDGALTLLVPGSGFSSGRVMMTLERFTRAVGAQSDRYIAAIRLGSLANDQ